MDTLNSREKAALSAELIQRMGWIVSTDQQAGKLTKAQWAALRFFSQASRLSRTLTAFADYHATTVGSASQTLKVLVERGILARNEMENDSRSICFSLTEEGWKLLRTNPGGALVQAIAALPTSDLVRLSKLLKTVHSSVVDTRQSANLGVCGTCSNYREFLHQTDGEAVGFCTHMKDEVREGDFNMLCASYQQRTTEEVA